MPTYVYTCARCETNHDVIKSYRELSTSEYCPDCGAKLFGPRVGTGFTKVSVSTPQFNAHYNHAFGKVVKNKSELKNEVRRYNGEHGTDLVEVGNEKLKRQKRDYSFKGDTKRIVQEMKSMRGR